MNGLSGWVLRHRLAVGLVWLAVTVVGVLIAPSVSGRLVSGNHIDSEAYRANVQIAQRYGGVTSDPAVLTLDLPPGTTAQTTAVAAELSAVDAAITRETPTARVVSYASTRSPALLGRDGTSTIVLAYPPHAGDDMDSAAVAALVDTAAAAAPGVTVHGTSLKALGEGNTTSSGSSSVLAELLIGGLGALFVLAWVFGSFLAFLPLVMAIVSVLTMQLLIYGLTYVTPASSPINPAVQYIVALLGLGLSIDYSLLVVTRWREERAAGRDNDDAVRAALLRAGHSVWFSGVVASLGLFALVVVPNSVVRGIGLSGLFIPSTATLVALTLLPAVLSKLGPRFDRPGRRRPAASRFWTWWAERVIRHRVVAATLGLGILACLAGTAATIDIAQPTSAALASSGPATEGLQRLQSTGLPTGVLTAVPILVSPANDADQAGRRLATVPALHGAVAPTGIAWRHGDAAVVIALPEHEVGSAGGGSTLDDIRHALPAGAQVGGEAAVSIDEVSTTYGSFPLLFAVVAIVTFALLARGLRSIVLPAKAVLLNVLSVAASYGILVLVFQHGWGMQALWGTSSYGAIDALAPVLVFGFLFGVSMDYEVFILARIREAYDRTGSTPAGIVEGISRTGRLVTSAALILFFALASLSTANDVTVRQIAAGLAAGVLLDAVVVRMLLLPALVSLFGAWNWWMPDRAARLLRLPVPLVTAPAVRHPERTPVGEPG